MAHFVLQPFCLHPRVIDFFRPKPKIKISISEKTPEKKEKKKAVQEKLSALQQKEKEVEENETGFEIYTRWKQEMAHALSLARNFGPGAARDSVPQQRPPP